MFCSWSTGQPKLPNYINARERDSELATEKGDVLGPLKRRSAGGTLVERFDTEQFSDFSAKIN